jgi:subtilase family serine protease
MTFTTFNGQKIVGKPNTVRFSIKNQGQTASGQAQALIKAGESQFVYLASIPPLEPGKKYIDEFTYTPDTCDKLVIYIDGQQWVNESNEDNNTYYEPGDTTKICQHRPDLYIKNVYWDAHGMSFADPYFGDWMYFDITIGDAQTEGSYGCVSTFSAVLRKNGQVAGTYTLYGIGCPSGGLGQPGPAVWQRHVKFGFIAKCEGQLDVYSLQIDPDNNIAEQLVNNNFWLKPILCTMAPPQAIPTN